MKTLIATLAITTSASADIVTFDNLPSTYNSTQYYGERLNVPLDGFTFTSSAMNFGSYYNWFYYNSQNSYISSPAYAIGVNGTNAIFSGYYQYNPNSTYNISRTDGGLWKFNQAVFTSVLFMGNIRLMGYRNGVQVLDIAQGISNTQQTVVSNSSYPGPDDRIDTLKITNTLGAGNNSSNRHFIMDDMHYTLFPVPAPSVLAMIGLAICGLGNRRRKDSNV